MLGGALAVVLLAALLRDADLVALARAAVTVPAWGWVLAALGLLASYALRALRLQAEWGPRIGARYRDCLHLMLVHNAAVNLLPMRAGEAGYPWLLHRRFGVPVQEAAASLLRLRGQDVLVLAVLGLALLVPHGPVVAALATVAVALAWIAFGRALAAFAQARADDHRAVQALRVAVRTLLARPAGARATAASWACAAANWIVKIGALGGLLAALAAVGRASGLRGALGGELAAVLPLQGPAGLGTYEGGVWAAVALHDRSALAQLGAAALSIHLFALVVGLAAAASVQVAMSNATALHAQGGTS